MTLAATRRLTVVAIALAVLAILVLTTRGEGDDRSFSVVVPAAANVVPGNKISAGGKPIGIVTGIDPVARGRAARLHLRIDDTSYWPVAQDSKLEIRQGGTVSFVNRYVLLTPGRRASGDVPADGELPPGNVKIPVELDTVISKLDTPTRTGIKRLIDNGSRTADAAGPDLNRALAKAPPVVSAAAGVLGDLAKNQEQVSALVASTSRVVDGVDRATPNLGHLLDGLGQTFAAVAAEQNGLKDGMTRLPAALVQTRATLAKADVTLRAAARLTDRIGPGVTELRRTAAPLNGVLAALRQVTPGAQRTLGAVRRTGVTSRALGRVADVAPLLGSVADKGAEQLTCIRPYAPEIAEFGTTWGDWLGAVDNRDHLARATVQNFLPANFNSVPSTAAEVVARNPGIEYAFPRPPGMLAAQPWFLPECGAGKDALDPTKDQESALYKAGTQKLPFDLQPSSLTTGGRP